LIVTVAPGAYGLAESVPSEQVTVLPFWAHDPWDAAADTKSTWLSSSSVSVTPLAEPGPRLVTVIV
jgi:hypothetical protein